MTTYRLTSRGAAVVVVASILSLAFVGVIATADAPATPTYPPCVTEDAPGPCHWNADTRGNGHGVSYVVMPDGSLIHLGK